MSWVITAAVITATAAGVSARGQYVAGKQQEIELKRQAEEEKIAAQARALGIDFQMRSALQVSGHARQAPLVILDTLGELQATYSVAAVVFCGGSLVPLGGQNVLEAAAWGKPVLFGPSMEDFQAEKELLVASGGGSEVADQRDLVAKIRFYLAHPDAAAQAGRAGRAMVQANTGAARKHADVILRALKKH